ncbi:MAG TPA: polymer-forming cytoskeletal protein [Rhizomicrobium sp.]|nr:polymer-forming cytoskeletal protein [Rhizomicrobium sp.]
MSAAPPKAVFTKPQNGNGAALPVSKLGKAIRVDGELETDGELHIQGVVTGRINAGTLVIAGDGYVEGDVVAREVRVDGRLNGRVFAVNVTLAKSANVTGRVFHNSVTVEQGARIDARMPWRPPSYFETLDQLPETKS